jgi:hypothetical protein
MQIHETPEKEILLTIYAPCGYEIHETPEKEIVC